MRLTDVPVLLDGATGSNLMAAGMPRGVCAEQWVLTHPDILQHLQRQYVQAGSQVLYAPTFTANSYYLRQHGLEQDTEQLNRELVALTRAVDANVCVAGDMTTLGQPVSADGPMTDAFLFEVYTRQAKALEAAGVDLFAVETMLGCTETAVAVEAIRSVSQKPVLCTLTVEADGRTFFGDDAVETAQVLQTLGVDAVGVNCSCGPAGLVAVVRRLHQAVPLPIVCKPNAGMPTIGNDGAAHYDLTPAEFARQMLEIRAAGAAILGGCCGTTPAHIRALHEALQDPFRHLR